MAQKLKNSSLLRIQIILNINSNTVLTSKIDQWILVQLIQCFDSHLSQYVPTWCNHEQYTQDFYRLIGCNLSELVVSDSCSLLILHKGSCQNFIVKKNDNKYMIKLINFS